MTVLEQPVSPQSNSDKGSPASDALALRAPERPLRIIHVVSSLKVGGMEHFVLRIAKAQQELGHKVTVLALQGGPLQEEAALQGLSVCVLGGAHKIPRVLRGLLTLARLRPDIVNAHNQTSLHYAVLSKWIGKARVVLTSHGEGANRARTPGGHEWRKTDALIAVSQAVEKHMQVPGYTGKTIVIHNGIECKPGRNRAEVRAELALPERPIGIIVARIDKLKGHNTLVEALALLRERKTPIIVLVAGDGAERANIEALAHSRQLDSDWVRFLGFRSDVADLLNAADFFVLPSLTEGLPLSVMEAMTHSLPIVATPVGGIPELVQDGQQGILTPVNDAEALAQAMETLAQDASLRQQMGEAAYEQVQTNFSFEEMTRRYLDLYTNLLRPDRI